MMKFDTEYGSISLNITEDDKIIVTSDVPFYKFEEIYNIEEIKDAKESYQNYVKTLSEIINEMKKKKNVAVSKMSTAFQKVQKLIDTLGGRRILLYGPTGTGKTHLLLSVCEELKNKGTIDDYLLFTMQSGMEDIDLLGKFIPQPDGSLTFIKSELLQYLERAVNEKIVIILDEFNRAHSKTLNILIPLLDEKDGKVRVNNYITGKILEIPFDNLWFLLTANFGGNYIGTFDVDDAILNRIDYVQFIDYQPDVEKTLYEHLSPLKIKFVEELTDFLRNAYKNGLINPFSTRDLKLIINIIDKLDDTDLKDINLIMNSIEPITYKLIKHDMFGYPDRSTLDEDIKGAIKEIIKKL